MNRIKMLRKENGITVKDLAEKLGISQSMMTNYENGSSTPRDESIWEKLADFFDVTVSYLRGMTDTLPSSNAPSKGLFLPVIALDVDRVRKDYIETQTPIEVQIDSPEDYAILANLTQLDIVDKKEILNAMLEIIRVKYSGTRTEFTIDN